VNARILNPSLANFNAVASPKLKMRLKLKPISFSLRCLNIFLKFYAINGAIIQIEQSETTNNL
jgi:hypothetical protein